MTERSEDILQA